MDSFRWEDSYSVGLETVDKQHKEFLRIINELGNCIAQKEHTKIKTEIYFSLVNFAHKYILEEKILANEVDNLDYSYFRQKHKEFMQKLQEFQDGCQQNCNEALFVELHNYLKQTYPDYLAHYTPTLVQKLKASGVS